MDKQEKEIYIRFLEISPKNASNTSDRDEILEKIREIQEGEKNE